ncbi:decapping endonuclease targeting mRNA [Blastocladiella emersonii ATCC 22665]|nr:decapping endonuclease targeting mRNA [Blastocladiella emersonii ATCC 22665]
MVASPPPANLLLAIPVPPPNQSPPPGPPVPVQQPTEVGRFSYDDAGAFHPDARSLRHWYPPTVIPVMDAGAREAGPPGVPLDRAPVPPAEARDQVDLNGQFEAYDPNVGNGIEPLDNLLRGLVAHGQWTHESGAPGISLVTWRGILTKLLVAPYNDRDEWELGAVYHRGTLFLHEHVTASQTRDRDAQRADPRRARMTFWGYRFESLSVLPSPPSTLPDLPAALRARVATPVNQHAQFCSVVRTKLGAHRVLVGAEVDCADSNGTYVELKTHRLGAHPRAHAGWRAKLLRVWAQSFLAGVPTVAVGFRDDDGIVRAVVRYRTLELPRAVRGAHDAWDPQLCLRFAADAVDRIVAAVRDASSSGSEGEAGHPRAFTIRFSPRTRAVHVLHTPGGTGDPTAPAPGCRRVLPDWFLAGASGPEEE